MSAARTAGALASRFARASRSASVAAVTTRTVKAARLADPTGRAARRPQGRRGLARHHSPSARAPRRRAPASRLPSNSIAATTPPSPPRPTPMSQLAICCDGERSEFSDFVRPVRTRSSTRARVAHAVLPYAGRGPPREPPGRAGEVHAPLVAVLGRAPVPRDIAVLVVHAVALALTPRGRGRTPSPQPTERSRLTLRHALCWIICSAVIVVAISSPSLAAGTAPSMGIS